jgi:hypothetical protein
MKKLFFVLGLSLMTNMVFANNKDKVKSEATETTACCTRSSSSGQPGTAGYVSVTVTKCVGAATRSDAMVGACHNASVAAAAAVKSLEDSSLTLVPTNH